MAAPTKSPPVGARANQIGSNTTAEQREVDPGRHTNDVSPQRSGLPTGSKVGALEGVGTTDRRGAAARQPYSDPSDIRTPLQVATEVKDPAQRARDEEEQRRRNMRHTASIDFEGLMAVEVDGQLADPRSGPISISFNDSLVIRAFTPEESLRFRALNRRADDRGFSDNPTIQPGRETESMAPPAGGSPAFARHRGQPTVSGQVGAGQRASTGPGGPIGGGPVGGNAPSDNSIPKVDPQKGFDGSKDPTSQGLDGSGGTSGSGTRAPGDGPENR